MVQVIPEVADTVFSAPDDGCCDDRNMQSDCAVNKCLHTLASSWTFLLTLNHDARNHEFKKNKYALSLSEAVTFQCILLIEQWMNNRVGHFEFQPYDPSTVISFTTIQFCKYVYFLFSFSANRLADLLVIRSWPSVFCQLQVCKWIPTFRMFIDPPSLGFK